MKHSLSAWLVLAATSCLFSCARETVEVRDRLSYESTIIVDLAETRTTNSGEATAWSDQDAITAIHTDTQGSGHNNVFYSSEFVYTGANNAFRGSVSDPADVNDWYLVYPYREENEDARQIHITVDNSPVQDGNDNMSHLAGPGFPLWGKKLGVSGKDIRMSMHQALAVLELKVDNALESPIVVKKIALAFPASMKESGNFVGDLTADNVQWTAEEGASSQLTLTVNNGAEISNHSAYFYVGVLPGTLKANQTLKVQVTAVDTNNPGTEFVYYKTCQYDTDHVLTANKIITIKNINVDKAHSEDPNPGEQPVLKDRAFSFTNAAVEWTIGVDCDLNVTRSLPQSVNGAKTDDAYYISSDETVAQIVKDGSTYKIKVLKDGETTITAKADATSEYDADQASYKLTVYEAAIVTPSTVTYRYASSISAGTYLIAGTETTGNQLTVALFPDVYTKTWTSNGENKQITDGQYLAHKVIGTYSNQNWPQTIEADATTDADMIASEVDLSTGSSNNTWKVKINANNKYLKTPSESYRIVYADDASSATSFTVTSTSINNGGYYFFHSRGAEGFTIRNTQQTTNLRFYKRESASTNQQNQTIKFDLTEYPFVVGSTYKLETAIDLPKVTGNKSKVTYTISNQDKAVAEVTEDGEHFIIHKAGTVTLSAQAAATASYYASNVATTKLVITESSSSSDKKDQTVTFSQQQKTVTWTLGQGYEKGESYLAEVPGGSYQSSLLEYTSSNDQVVAVDGKRLRIVGTGTSTITAKAKGNDEYNESNADTYTLTVAGSGSVSGDRTYEYATSIQAGETYIITGIETDGGNFSVALFPNVESHNWTSTSTSENISGQRVPQKVLGTYTSQNWPSTVTASSTSDADIIAAEVTFVSAGNNTWKIKFKNGKYLSVPSQNYNVPLVDTESAATNFSVGTNSISYSTGSGSGSGWGSGWGSGSSNSTYYFFHSKGAEGFTFRSGTSTTNLRFYRLTSGGGTAAPQNQTPSFPNQNVSWTLGQNGHTVGSNHTITSFNNPTGVQTTITGYTSDNTNVATIVNTNQVHIVGGTGTAKITATVSSNSEWNAATFSFNLTINPESSTPETPGTDGTYQYVSSLSEGQYLICGYEDDATYVCLFPQKESNLCDHLSVGDQNISSFSTNNNSAILASVVTLSKSGNNWLIKLNSTGQYLYCDAGNIGFTTNASTAALSITQSSSTGHGYWVINNASGSYTAYDFYHSTSNVGFRFLNDKDVNNIKFFKYTENGGGSQGGDVTPTEGNGLLENSKIYSYLNAADANYLYTGYTTPRSSIVSQYADKGNSTNRWDWPRPVVVNWTTSHSGNPTMTVYYVQGSTQTEEVMAVSTIGTTSAEIYNLIPGRTCRWELKSGSTVLESGTFSTTGRRRMIAIGQKSDYDSGKANNCRDLGGLKAGNKTIKFGKIYRGSNMNDATDAQKTYIKQKMGIALDVDLRTSNGANYQGQRNRLTDALNLGDITIRDANDYTGHTVEEYNGASTLENASNMKATLTRIFNAVHNNTNVYIHCMVGADRTGTVCMILEGLLGVQIADCDKDFELTSFSTVGTRACDGSSNTPEQYPTVIKDINNSNDSGSGDFNSKVYNYCVNHFGISAQAIEQFRNDMLE